MQVAVPCSSRSVSGRVDPWVGDILSLKPDPRTYAGWSGLPPGRAGSSRWFHPPDRLPNASSRILLRVSQKHLIANHVVNRIDDDVNDDVNDKVWAQPCLSLASAS